MVIRYFIKRFPIDPYSGIQNEVKKGAQKIDIPPFPESKMKLYGAVARYAQPFSELLHENLGVAPDDPVIKEVQEKMTKHFGGDAAQGEPLEDLRKAPQRVVFDIVQSMVREQQGPY